MGAPALTCLKDSIHSSLQQHMKRGVHIQPMKKHVYHNWATYISAGRTMSNFLHHEQSSKDAQRNNAIVHKHMVIVSKKNGNRIQEEKFIKN